MVSTRPGFLPDHCATANGCSATVCRLSGDSEPQLINLQTVEAPWLRLCQSTKKSPPRPNQPIRIRTKVTSDISFSQQGNVSPLREQNTNSSENRFSCRHDSIVVDSDRESFKWIRSRTVQYTARERFGLRRVFTPHHLNIIVWRKLPSLWPTTAFHQYTIILTVRFPPSYW